MGHWCPRPACWTFGNPNRDFVTSTYSLGVNLTTQGKHKPIYAPSVDCGDFVVVVNSSEVVFTGKKWDKKLIRFVCGSSAFLLIVLGGTQDTLVVWRKSQPRTITRISLTVFWSGQYLACCLLISLSTKEKDDWRWTYCDLHLIFRSLLDLTTHIKHKNLFHMPYTELFQKICKHHGVWCLSGEWASLNKVGLLKGENS